MKTLTEQERADEAAWEAAYDAAESAAESAHGERIDQEERARDEAAKAPLGVTGAEADIEANYPGGLAAFRRDEPVDRTPRHKGDNLTD